LASRALVCVAWILWILASLLQHANAKLEGRLAADAGLSLAPIIPLVPVGLIGVATVVDYFVEPWGSWFIGGLHGLLAVASVVAIVRAAVRLQGSSVRNHSD
jgi:hypothetical protein